MRGFLKSPSLCLLAGLLLPPLPAQAQASALDNLRSAEAPR